MVLISHHLQEEPAYLVQIQTVQFVFQQTPVHLVLLIMFSIHPQALAKFAKMELIINLAAHPAWLALTLIVSPALLAIVRLVNPIMFIILQVISAKFAALACIIQMEYAFLVLIQIAKLALQEISALLATIHIFYQEILASLAQMATIL